MNRRKIIAVFLLTVLAVSGCSENTPETSEQTETQTEIAAETENVEETEIAEVTEAATESQQETVEFTQLLPDFAYEAVIHDIWKDGEAYYANTDIAGPVVVDAAEIDALEIGSLYQFPDTNYLSIDANGKSEITPESGVELEYVMDDGQYKYFSDPGMDPSTFSIEGFAWDDTEYIYRLAEYNGGYRIDMKYMNTMPGEFYAMLSYEAEQTIKINPAAKMLYYDATKGFPEYQKYDECSFDEFYNGDMTSCWNEQMGFDNWKGLYSFVSVKADADGVVTEIGDGFPAG